MTICFVIQPFDNGPFDKRYEDVFVPAIAEAGLDPYRVDLDPSVSIPIEQIEEGIRRADACLADISTNNPNVWFELGFAVASGKPVLLVCEYQPDRRFPFDIQHRSIIIYKTESARDFESLKVSITRRLQAAMSKDDAIERVAESSRIADVEGLNQHEIVALITIAENSGGGEDTVSFWSVRQDMERAGYTRIAAKIALTTLLRKEMVVSFLERDDRDGTYTSYSLTDKGLSWLIDNQNMFVLKQERKKSKQIDDDIPF